MDLQIAHKNGLYPKVQGLWSIILSALEVQALNDFGMLSHH